MVAYIFCNSSAHLQHLKDNKCLNQPYIVYIYLSESSQMLRGFNLYHFCPFSNNQNCVYILACKFSLFSIYQYHSLVIFLSPLQQLKYTRLYIPVFRLRILPNIALVSISLSFVDIMTSCHHSSMDYT